MEPFRSPKACCIVVSDLEWVDSQVSLGRVNSMTSSALTVAWFYKRGDLDSKFRPPISDQEVLFAPWHTDTITFDSVEGLADVVVIVRV